MRLSVDRTRDSILMLSQNSLDNHYPSGFRHVFGYVFIDIILFYNSLSNIRIEVFSPTSCHINYVFRRKRTILA